MGRLRFNPKRVFDFSIVALALGCGCVGYYYNLNEDETGKTKRLHREQVRRQRLREIEFKRRLELWKSLSKEHEEEVELLLQKRQEMMDLSSELNSLTLRLLEGRKELQDEIEEIRKLVKVKEELRARSRALSDSVSKSNESA